VISIAIGSHDSFCLPGKTITALVYLAAGKGNVREREAAMAALIYLSYLKGQSHEKVGEIRVWGGSLDYN
jgi:hypothetical protein